MPLHFKFPIMFPIRIYLAIVSGTKLNITILPLTFF